MFRQPLLRWETSLSPRIGLALAAENPSPDHSATDGSQASPDTHSWRGSLRVRDASLPGNCCPGRGHAQFALLVRQLRGEPVDRPNTTVSTGGVGVHGAAGSTRRGATTDSLMFATAVGSGIGRDIADLGSLGGQDTVYDPTTNTLHALFVSRRTSATSTKGPTRSAPPAVRRGLRRQPRHPAVRRAALHDARQLQHQHLADPAGGSRGGVPHRPKGQHRRATRAGASSNSARLPEDGQSERGPAMAVGNHPSSSTCSQRSGRASPSPAHPQALARCWDLPDNARQLLDHYALADRGKDRGHGPCRHPLQHRPLHGLRTTSPPSRKRACGARALTMCLSNRGQRVVIGQQLMQSASRRFPRLDARIASTPTP